MTRNIWGRSVLGAFTVGAVAVSAFGFVPAAAAASGPVNVRTFDIAAWDTSAKPLPAPPKGWFKQSDNQAGATAVGAIVPGTDGGANDGSLRLAVTTTEDKVALQHLPATATALADFTTGSYLAKVVKGTSPAVYQLAIDCNGGDLSSGFTTLNFSTPNQAPTDGWKTLTVGGDDAQWWSSRTINADGTTTSDASVDPGADGIKQLDVKTFADFKKVCPNGTVLTYGIDLGSGVKDYESDVDAVTFNGEVSNFEWASVERISGDDRIATSIGGSKALFDAAGTKDANRAAQAVVLANSDGFADGLAAGPLAAYAGGPLLLNGQAGLDARVSAEIQRILPRKAADGSKNSVLLVGGTGALGTAVATSISRLGYDVVRIAGSDRFDTAVQVAAAMDAHGPFLLTDGTQFADALSAGPAAAHLSGKTQTAALLLTNGTRMPDATRTFLADNAGATVYAIGGAATKAAPATPKANQLAGKDRFETSVLTARTFFTQADAPVFASGLSFPDALSGGAFAGLADQPILLVQSDALPASVSGYLTDNRATVEHGAVFGGTASVSPSVVTATLAVLNAAS